MTSKKLTITTLRKELLDNQQEQNQLRYRLAYHHRRTNSVDRFASDLAVDSSRLKNDTRLVLCDTLHERFMAELKGLVRFLPHGWVTINDARVYFPQIDQNPPGKTETLQFDKIWIPPQPSGSANTMLDLRVITTRGEAVLEKAVEVLPAD